MRVKQHPNRQPGREVAVNRGDQNDRESDQDFESNWIDGVFLPLGKFYAGRPFRAIVSINSQKRSNSLRVVYRFGVMRMPVNSS